MSRQARDFVSVQVFTIRLVSDGREGKEAKEAEEAEKGDSDGLPVASRSAYNKQPTAEFSLGRLTREASVPWA